MFWVVEKSFARFFDTKSLFFSILVSHFLLYSTKKASIAQHECYQTWHFLYFGIIFQKKKPKLVQKRLIYIKKMIPNWRFSLIWYHFFAFSAHSTNKNRIFGPFSEQKRGYPPLTVSETAHGESSRLYALANRRNGPRQTCSPCSPLCVKASTASYPTCQCRQRLPLATAK